MAEPRTLPDYASIMIGRFQFAQRAGLTTYLGRRNTTQAFGYDDNPTLDDYRVRYERGGIAGRIVDAYPDATWSDDITVAEDEKPKNKTIFEQTWDDLQLRLGIWSIFNRADKLAGLTRYSVILLGAKGELDTPLPRATGPQDLLYLQPYSERDAVIDTFVSNTSDARFALPEYYVLKRGLAKRVHWTRMIHLAENCLEDTLFSPPRLQRPWNRLDDLEKVIGGGAEAFFQRANQGLQFDLDKEVELDPEEEKKFSDQIDAYKNNIVRIMKTRGVKTTSLGSDVADFSGPADAIITQIAGMEGIPKRILTGSEMGQLASGQDADNWDVQVSARIKKYANPRCVRPFIDRLIEYNYLPKPKQYKVIWPEKDKLTETEKASVANQMAMTNRNQGELVFAADEIRERVYNMEPRSAEQIAAYGDTHPIKDPNAVPANVDANGDPIKDNVVPIKKKVAAK